MEINGLEVGGTRIDFSPKHLKAGGVKRLSLVSLLGADARQASNDEPDTTVARREVPVALPLTTQEQIDALKRGWMFVGAAHQNYNPHCEHCDYRNTVEGAPGEQLSECGLGRGFRDRPEDCPAYRAELDNEAEQAAMAGASA